MDSSSFDRLARLFVASSPTRRGLGGAVIGALLGMTGTALPEEAAAHDARKRCRKFSGKKKKTCIRAARKHNRRRHGTTPPECTEPANCEGEVPACAEATCLC